MPGEPIGKILPKFIDDLKNKGRSPATILAYRADLNQLVSHLTEKGRALPEQVQKEDVERLLGLKLTLARIKCALLPLETIHQALHK